MNTLDLGCTISVKYKDETRYQLENITDFCFYLQKQFDITFPAVIHYLPTEQAIIDDREKFYYISGPTSFSFTKKYQNSEFSLIIDTQQKYFHFILGPMLNQKLKIIIASYIIRHNISLLKIKMKYFFVFAQNEQKTLKQQSHLMLPLEVICNEIKFNRISHFDSDFFETDKFELYSAYQSEPITSNYEKNITLCYDNELLNKIKLENLLKEEK